MCMPSGKRQLNAVAVVILTTAYGIQPTFSGRHTQIFIIPIFTDGIPKQLEKREMKIEDYGLF